MWSSRHRYLLVSSLCSSSLLFVTAQTDLPALDRQLRVPFRILSVEMHTNILRAHLLARSEELREALTQPRLVTAAAATFADGKQTPIAALCYRNRCRLELIDAGGLGQTLGSIVALKDLHLFKFKCTVSHRMTYTVYAFMHC